MSQQHKLIMTQGMKQSINILQMSAQDLREYIDKEYEENPVIDIEYRSEKDSFINEKFDIYIRQENYYLSSGEEYNVFDFIKEEETLKDYLYEQLVTIKCDNSMKKTIVYMIDSLDDNGYLSESLESICKIQWMTLNRYITSGWKYLDLASGALMIQRKGWSVLSGEIQPPAWWRRWMEGL